MKSVAIITPTIGSVHLNQCMESVQSQNYPNLTHYIVIDGDENAAAAYDNFPRTHQQTVKDTVLSQNVGANGWYGHRIYAAFSFLVNEDLVCFLDEDNWLEPNHVEKMVHTMDTECVDWTCSLRNIHRKDGTFVCQDNCENIGEWGNHVDTSAYMVKRDVLVRLAQVWYGQYGQDRVFFTALKQYFPSWKTTCNYSLNYRLDGNPGSVTEDFFHQGNKYMEEVYEGNFPWRNAPK